MGIKNNITFGVAIGNHVSVKKPYLFGGDIAKSIREARDCGYDGVELHNVRNPRDTDIKKILKYCDKFNIKISAISTGPSNYIDKLSLIDDSANIREVTILRLIDYIDLAGIIGGFITIGTIRGNIPDESSYEIYENRLSESLKRVSEYAYKKNITMLLEVANRYESNYLNRAEDILNFIKKNNILMLKIHLDTFHMNIEEVDINKSIKECSQLLGYFHVADSNRMYPGAGHLDFKSMAKTLINIDYHGYVVVECLPLPDGKSAAKKALDYIKPLLK